MSRFIWTRVLISIIIGFGGTFLLIIFMFEALGIAELVWPILFPILGGTFAIMMLILVVVSIVCTVAQAERPTVPSDEEMVLKTYSQPTFRTGDYSDGAIYTVPMYCPHCKYKIELNQVEWVGSSELTCSNCFRVIQAGVRESL